MRVYGARVHDGAAPKRPGESRWDFDDSMARHVAYLCVCSAIEHWLQCHHGPCGARLPSSVSLHLPPSCRSIPALQYMLCPGSRQSCTRSWDCPVGYAAARAGAHGVSGDVLANAQARVWQLSQRQPGARAYVFLSAENRFR